MNRTSFVVVFLASLRVTDLTSQATSRRSLVERLLNQSTYDATVRPFATTGSAVHVEVDMLLTALGPLNESDMDFSITLYLRQKWTDPRLAFSDVNRSIVVSHKLLPLLWVPDLFFPISKEERAHELTTPNLLIRLYPDGRILYSLRVSLKLRCLMDLERFPLDEQICKIQIESYGHTLDDVIMEWSKERRFLDILPDAYLPDFKLMNVTPHICTHTYATGVFPCLYAQLIMQREIGYYMTQSYIPTMLIVMLSWASFWIDHEAVPARISVGLLTVLTITTQSSGALSQLPKVPYVKAIDVWMSMCLVFVFAAYMEYAVATVLTRRYKKKCRVSEGKSKKKSKTNRHNITQVKQEVGTDKIPTDFDGRETAEEKPVKRERFFKAAHKVIALARHNDPGRRMEKISRIVFPTSFVVFNIVYWSYYVLVTSHHTGN